MKKISTVLMSLAMGIASLFLISSTAMAGEVYSYGGIQYRLTEENGKRVASVIGPEDTPSSYLDIPGVVYSMGEAYTIVEIEEGAFADYSIMRVTLPASVKRVGADSFKDSFMLTISLSCGSELKATDFGMNTNVIRSEHMITGKPCTDMGDGTHTGICSECGAENVSSSHIMGADGRCSLCLADVKGYIDADGYDYQGILYYIKGSEAMVYGYRYNATSADITIPSQIYRNGQAFLVDSIAGSAFVNCKTIDTLRLPRSIESLSSDMFTDCKSDMIVYVSCNFSTNPEEITTVTVEKDAHVIDFPARDYGDGTHRGVCSICGEKDALASHTYSESGYCPSCEVYLCRYDSRVPHIPSEGYQIEVGPGCVIPGSQFHPCSVCGVKCGEDEMMDPIGSHDDPEGDGLCNVCGEIVDGVAAISGYSLSLTGNLLMNIRIELGEQAVEDDIRILIRHLSSKDTVVSLSQCRKENGSYIYQYPIAAADYAKPVTIQVKNSNTEGVMVELSAEDYLQAAEKLYFSKEIAKAILDYCRDAKIYFGDQSAAQARDYSDFDLNVEPVLSGGTALSQYYYGSSLLLRDNVTIRHYYTQENGAALAMADHSGTRTVDEQVLYYYDMEDIGPDHYADNSAGQNQSFQYSVYTYLSLGFDRGGTALKNLCQSMYRYSKAAIDYKEVAQVEENIENGLPWIEGFEFAVSDEERVIEREKIIVHVEAGVYMTPEFPDIVQTLLSNIEEKTKLSFFPHSYEGKKINIYVQVDKGQAQNSTDERVNILDIDALIGNLNHNYNTLIHELLHVIALRNFGELTIVFAEGFAESLSGTVEKDIDFYTEHDERRTQAGYMSGYGAGYYYVSDEISSNLSWITEDNMEELFFANPQDHGHETSYWIVEYIRERYGDEAFWKLISQVSALNRKPEWHIFSLREKNLRVLEEIKSELQNDNFVSDLYFWFKETMAACDSNRVGIATTDQMIIYPEYGSIDKYNHGAEIQAYRINPGTSVVIDYTEFLAFAQQVLGFPIKGVYLNGLRDYEGGNFVVDFLSQKDECIQSFDVEVALDDQLVKGSTKIRISNTSDKLIFVNVVTTGIYEQ